MKRIMTVKRLVLIMAAVAALALSGVVLAHLGVVLRQFAPAITPQGNNGRAVAFDPATDRLFYTGILDTRIYVVDTANAPVGSIAPVQGPNKINYGALSWDAKRGVLWGGRYQPNGGIPGGVDTIPIIINGPPAPVTPRFAFAFPPGDSCLPQPPGFIDGLAYDEGPTLADADDSLWLSDDLGRTLYHVTLAGTIIGANPVPGVGCNSGIAADGQYLWLALSETVGGPPTDIARVAKPTAPGPLPVLSSFNTGRAIEDIELDLDTFTPQHCALWSNQAGPTTLTAWGLEHGIKPECPSAPDLTVTKELKPGQPAPVRGGTLAYIVKVKNVGTEPTPPAPTDVVLRDTPPGPFLSYTANSGICSWNGTVLECKRGRMAVGEEWWVELKIKIPNTSGPITNRVVVDPFDRIKEIDENNNTATLVTIIP